MRLAKQSSTQRPLLFLLVDSTDHVTAKTGLTPTVTISKNGAAFAGPAGAVTEVGSGWYKVAGNATDTNTLGSLILHATGTAADPCDVEFEIVAFDPQATSMGLSLAKTTNLTGLNDIAATDVWAAGTRSLTDKAGFTISGTLTTLDALNTGLSSTHGAGAWATATGFSTHSATDVWAAGARTLTSISGLGISTLSTGDIPTVAAIADGVWDEAAAGHVTTSTFGSYLDQKVSEVSGGGGEGGGLTEEQAEQLESAYNKTLLITAGDVTIASPVTVASGAITAKRGDTWSINLTGLGSLAGLDDVIFGVKATAGSQDETAMALISLSAGLESLAGNSNPDAALGSITVNDEDTGDITVTIKAAATARIQARTNCVYGVKTIAGEVATTIVAGTFTVTELTIEQV